MAEAQALTNRPQIPSVDALRELLADENADLIKRRDELLAAAKRVPDAINSDEVSGKVSDFIRQLDAAIKNTESKRVDAKGPALDAGKAIDAFFGAIREPIFAAKRAIESRLQVYLRKKADEARRIAEKEAAEKEAEAARAAAAATKAIGTAPKAVADAKIDAAAQAADVAQAAADVAAAKPAEFARTRGELGAVATLRTDWTGELVDRAVLDLEALRQHIPTDGLEKAIRAFVRAGGRDLRGAKIYERQTAQVR